LTLEAARLYSSGVKGPRDNPAQLDAENKIRLLKGLAVFQSLQAEELQAIAQSSDWRSYDRGELVYPREAGSGHGGGRIYAIQRGEVLITKSGDEHRDVALATFVEGEGLGELSFFDRGRADTAARCEQDTTPLVFPGAADDRRASDQAEELFRRYPQIKAKILRTMLVIVARRIRNTNRLIAEKSPWVQELRRQVMLDKLTGLYNAGYLEEDFPGILERCSQGTCFLMIKPDNLKSLNDSYGHQAGDRTLQLMADELRSQLGEQGIPIRYKGDVFSVILPETGLTAARRIAARIRAAMSRIDVSEVSRESENPRTDLRITVSIGVSASPGGGNSADQLIERAYQNMFTARNRGGNRICGQLKK